MTVTNPPAERLARAKGTPWREVTSPTRSSTRGRVRDRSGAVVAAAYDWGVGELAAHQGPSRRGRTTFSEKSGITCRIPATRFEPLQIARFRPGMASGKALIGMLASGGFQQPNIARSSVPPTQNPTPHQDSRRSGSGRGCPLPPTGGACKDQHRSARQGHGEGLENGLRSVVGTNTEAFTGLHNRGAGSS